MPEAVQVLQPEAVGGDSPALATRLHGELRCVPWCQHLHFPPYLCFESDLFHPFPKIFITKELMTRGVEKNTKLRSLRKKIILLKSLTVC